jgi:alanine racemase
LARRLQTINYEILCGISTRVPRAYHRDGEPA